MTITELHTTTSTAVDHVGFSVLGCDVTVVPRTQHGGADDPRLRDALDLERTTMRLLGDSPDEIESDLAETLARSSFALVTEPAASPREEPQLVGAMRFMLGADDGVKTLWDVERVSDRRHPAPLHRWIADPTQLVDALSLAVSLAAGRNVAAIADVLLAVCRCLGGALLHTGRARYVTGYLHQRFLYHAGRIGYPFERLVRDEHPANGGFVPVVASLEAYDDAVRAAPAISHLGAIRPDYLHVCDVAGTLETAAW